MRRRSALEVAPAPPWGEQEGRVGKKAPAALPSNQLRQKPATGGSSLPATSHQPPPSASRATKEGCSWVGQQGLPQLAARIKEMMELWWWRNQE